MKKIRTLLFAAAAAATIVSCDNGGDEDPGKAIELAPGTETNLTLYADQTAATASGGISFTTSGPWRATVAETRASEVEWITLSPDYGDAAGDYTVTVTLGVNTSGADRRATITIECGATKVTITVEQKATTEAGDIPDEGVGPAPGTPSKLISQIRFIYGNLSYTDDGEIDYTYAETKTADFTYDDQNRLTRIKEVYKGGEVIETREFQFEYGEGTVHVTSVYSENSESFKDEPVKYTAYLNEAGYVARIEWEDEDKAPSTYTYDEQNRLIRVEEDGMQADYIWENGNIVETRINYPDDEESYAYHYTYYEEYPNKENFELYYEDFSWDEELRVAGLIGIGNSHLVKQCRGVYDTKSDFDTTYEFDGEGFVTSYEETYNPNSSQRIYEITYIDAK